MPYTFLALTGAGLLLALNAKRPARGSALVVPAFFASWVVAETAPQLLVIHIFGVAVFAAVGGLESWPDYVALGLGTATTFVLADLVRSARRAGNVLDDALTGIGVPSSPSRRAGWRDYAFPFRLWSPSLRRVRNVVYAPPGGRRLCLDVWFTDDGASGKPCLLYVPGGAWLAFVTNKEQQGRPLLLEMATRGWVCFAVNYPTSPRARFPEHLVAVKKAISWIRSNATDYGGDASFLMLSGNSAGGHLSSLAALSANDPSFQPGFEDADTSIQAAAPVYGVYDLAGELSEGPRSLRRYTRRKMRFIERSIARRRLSTDRAFFESISPLHRAGDHAPGFFIVHGDIDTLARVDEGRALAAKLRARSKAPVAYAELPGAQHAYDVFLSIRSIETARAIARFGDWCYGRWKASVSGDVLREQH